MPGAAMADDSDDDFKYEEVEVMRCAAQAGPGGSRTGPCTGDQAAWALLEPLEPHR